MPKISDLTAATSVGATDVIPIVQSGTTKKLTATTLTGFAKTAAETSAGVTPSDLSYAPGDVRRYGADPTGVTESTTAIAAALSASLRIYCPAGTYLVDTVIVNRDGATIDTDGFATIFQQTTGNVETRLICIAASNVTLGTCTVKGNIATDSSEQNHGVFVYKSGGSISNITIGDVYGQDLRGDVLYLGAPSSYTTARVRFGRIVGKNVLRNVVSIVGASYVSGDAAISDTSTGLWALDIEPDTVTSHDIYVGYVRGAAMGCVPPLAANAAYNIHIGMADLDPAYAANSTPTYASRDVSSALSLRNIKGFRIDHLKAKDHASFAVKYIYNSGEQRGQGIEIGFYDVASVGASESTYNTTFLASAVDSVTIRDGRVTHQAVDDSVILGDTSGSTYTRAIIDRLEVDGRVARYISQGRFSNILVNTSAAATAFVNCYDCTILDSVLTIPTLMSYSGRNVLVNVTATCSTAYYGTSVTDMTRVNCSFGGTLTPFATTRAAAAGMTGEAVIGNATQTTVGAAGAASALPANPTGYLKIYIGSTHYAVPYYAQA